MKVRMFEVIPEGLGWGNRLYVSGGSRKRGSLFGELRQFPKWGIDNDDAPRDGELRHLSTIV